MDLRGGSITMETLKRFSAADLDPYTVELAQSLCERFNLSQIGHRNLSDTFGSLPGIQVFEQNFEAGYGQRHPVPPILNTNSGSVLAAIVGSLSESFTEQIVVDFFVALTSRANVPRANRPTSEQWRRLVDIFYGILVPSTFGFLLATIASACPRPIAEPDPERILKALDRMSERTHHRGEDKRAIVIEADSEAAYLTAVSTWLFGLTTTVSTISNEVIYSNSAGGSVPSIEIQLMPQKAMPTLMEGLRLSPSPNSRTKEQSKTSNVTGGRVPFERFFESCFGPAFNSLSKDTLSSFVCCASNIIQHNHRHDLRKQKNAFLPQPGAQKEDDKYSLKETLLAWFPEIRRISSRIEKHAHLDPVQSKVQFEKATNDLREQCQCATCHRNADPLRACQVSIALLVVKMGLCVSRIVLSPRVFPKQSGVMILYEQCVAQYAAWRNDGTTISASEYFTYHTLGTMPLSTELLRSACVLFAAADPAAALAPGTEVMGTSYRGFAIFLTGFIDLGEKLGGLASAVSVRVMPGWLCPFGHEMKLEIYEPALLGMTFNESWNTILSTKDINQILKRKGDVVLTSIVYKGTPLAEQAKLEGWLLADNDLGS